MTIDIELDSILHKYFKSSAIIRFINNHQANFVNVPITVKQ